MPGLEVFDTVVLKVNRQLVGTVDRTHHENNDPLQDILIIAHVAIEQAALTEFVTTGTPPKNHVFVRFANEAQGSSLVREDDVVLIDRSFNLGDVVKKQDDHLLGTVTSVTGTFVLQPIWLDTGNTVDGNNSVVTLDSLSDIPPHVCTRECPFGVLPEVEHKMQTFLLHNIPGEELKKAEDVLEADYVLQDDWLGVAEELELMVIVLLEDQSIVIVKEPDELYIPVEDSGKPLVSLPEFDNLARPDPLVALQGWSATVPPHDFQCGQMVITNQRNLRLGRWLRGQHNPQVKPQGRILDVRTRSMEVRWLTCNALIPEKPFIANRPQAHFRVGDHVKYRDQPGAALKYQSVPSSTGMLHGGFHRIASAKTFGFDVNEFKVISSRQEATVLWHDGSSSKHLSKTLSKFTLFEPELAPADIVVAREGMKQALRPNQGLQPLAENLEDFNEMKFFEKPHDLVPKGVGIVQNVNQKERVAQVRWFANPRVRLTTYGHVLTPDSRFGVLSEVVEDVSLYEIMTFPALIRHLKDLVAIPPSTLSSTTVDMMKQFKTFAPECYGQCSLSQINPYATEDLLYWLTNTAYSIIQDSAPPIVLEAAYYKSHPASDWVGEIVRIGLDGFITVRISHREACKDVRIEHDQVICLIDDAAIGGADTFHELDVDGSDMDLSLDGSGSEDVISTISETVEYEGGERLDNDSGDENWEDEEEHQDEGQLDAMHVDERPAHMSSAGTITPAVDTNQIELKTGAISGDIDDQPTRDGRSAQIREVEAKDLLSKLRLNMPSLQPPSFSVLERDPPVGQYQGPDKSLVSTPTFLKRISKEHRILTSSLPQGEIFVRTYETRLDLMRCLILGPADTPYEHAPFVIDLQLGKNFPREPPVAHFHSWTSGLGRINPNLYEEGKICLSLLGTWPGKAETEGWSEKATILQLLVSLQGLVFVRQPFYNEAGFEGYAEDDSYSLEAQRYNEKAFVMARGFVKHAVLTPVHGLEDVLAWTYLSRDNSPGLLQTIIARSYTLIESSECIDASEGLVDGAGTKNDKTRVFLSPLSRGAIVMLKKIVASLDNLLTIPSTTEVTTVVE